MSKMRTSRGLTPEEKKHIDEKTLRRLECQQDLAKMKNDPFGQDVGF